jgi:amidase
MAPFNSASLPHSSSFTLQRGDLSLLTPNMAATVTISSGATWQEVAADRQKHRDATLSLLDPPLPPIEDIPLNTIPLARKFLTADEIKITETLVEDLVPQLAKGELSSMAVTKAFLRRAGLAQKAVCTIPPLLLWTPAKD